jgi:quinohemoprotein ethanol dehydrogenase
MPVVDGKIRGSCNTVNKIIMKIFGFSLLLLLSLSSPGHAAGSDGRVDSQRVKAEAETGQNWLINGGSENSDHYSPLRQINRETVERLSLAWSLNIDSPDGLSATPIVVDGIAYFSGAFSRVWAVDVREGRLLWSFEPEINLVSKGKTSWAVRVNRGVAVWHGKVVVATADCRLIALEANSGEIAWSKQICDNDLGYRMNAAPIVGGKLVFIGNGGSEQGQKNRGYVTAHDIDTGKEVWRFYTVPSGTGEDQKTPAMRMAAATWTGETWKVFGGGGSVWDSMTYDASTGLLIFGTAGSLPFIHKFRSPEGGDNLFTESVVAVDAKSGEYAWHYQTVPGDSWEYNATMNIVLADLPINGLPRQVAMIAPKNGFFYVLDRKTGQLISGDPYARVNWASGIDPESGRPIITGDANYWERPGETTLVWPNAWGAHSWNPMAYHPVEKLVYIPTIDLPDEVHYEGGEDYDSHVVWPDKVDGKKHVPSRLVAWDPVARKPRWTVNHQLPLNGGVLTTAGGLVFQGTATGKIQAFSSTDGSRLWSVSTGSAISAAPVTFELNEEQYLLVSTGGGGGLRLVYPEWSASEKARGTSSLLAFKLDGNAKHPSLAGIEKPLPEPPESDADPEQIALGKTLYSYECMYCHGVNVRTMSESSIPDLRYSNRETHLQWNEIVIGGSLSEGGMYGFDYTPEEAQAMRAWVIHRAREDYENQ